MIWLGVIIYLFGFLGGFLAGVSPMTNLETTRLGNGMYFTREIIIRGLVIGLLWPLILPICIFANLF